jgi:hypothetical protein
VGVHWHAESPELVRIHQALDDVESRIFAPGASASAIEGSLVEREALYRQEDTERKAWEERGRGITWREAAGWPEPVRRHLYSYGRQPEERSVLDLLEWGADYYAENLRAAAGYLHDLSPAPFGFSTLTPGEASTLAVGLLDRAAGMDDDQARRAARIAGLWLWAWASVGAIISSAH